LAKHAFSDPAWVFEAKLDGQRSLLWKRRTIVRLITRNQKDRTSHYPDLVEAVRRDDTAALIADGEIVAFRGDVTSFSRLQERMQNARPSAAQVAAVPVLFYLFDLIWFDGYDLSALPLLVRKSVLRRAITFEDPIRFSEHLEEEGEVAFRAACEKGWGGPHRQTCLGSVHPYALEGLVEVQVRERAGARRPGVDRPARGALGSRGAAGRLPRGRRAAVRRQGGHRLR
jgi:hypothetical protein